MSEMLEGEGVLAAKVEVPLQGKKRRIQRVGVKVEREKNKWIRRRRIGEKDKGKKETEKWKTRRKTKGCRGQKEKAIEKSKISEHLHFFSFSNGSQIQNRDLSFFV